MSIHDIGGSDESAAGMGLGDYIRVARTYWRSIAAVTLAVTLLAAAWSTLQPRVYAAEASAVVLATGTDNISSLLAGENLAKAKAKNYKSLAESRLVAENVRESTGLATTAEQLLKTITVTVPLETAEIRLKAESPDPTTAQRVADAWIAELGRQVQERERAAATGETASPAMPGLALIPLDAAVVPSQPITPGPALAAVFGAAGGFLVAYASALLRNHLDRRLRTATEIERVFSVPVIGALPDDPRLAGKTRGPGGLLPLPGTNGQNPAFTEALRELRTNLTFLDVDNPPRVIVVTSSVSAEGKSTVAANLATAIAAAGDNVVVVDGDLRHPSMAKIFDVVPGVGITDVLTGKALLSEVLQQRSDLPNLSILGSGRIPPNPSELLSSHAMKHLIDSLAVNAIVIIDAPPLLPVTDAALLARIAHGAIVVVRAGKTTTEQLAKSLGNLRKVNGAVLGTLLNGLPAKEFDGYSYYTPEPTPAEGAPLSSPGKAPRAGALENHSPSPIGNHEESRRGVRSA